ncbi:MAG: hypothetical protein HC904_17350 [Blastochloris sp.]|nr:hypothetical protein [Blastochloris sp.]
MKRCFIICFLAALAALYPAVCWTADSNTTSKGKMDDGALSAIERLLLSKGIFRIAPDKAIVLFSGQGYFWTCFDKSEAVSYSPENVLWGLPIQEVILRFSGDHLSEVRLSLYNRVNVGDRSSGQIQQILSRLTNSMELIGKANYRDKLIFNEKGHRWVESVWANDSTHFRLIFGTSKIGWSKTRPEFVTMVVTPVKFESEPMKVITSKSRGRQPNTNGNGDVWLNVPMVIKPDPGLCGPASLERILKCKAVDVDKFQIADLAETKNKKEGTTMANLLAAAKLLAGFLKGKVSVLQDWNSSLAEDVITRYKSTPGPASKDEAEIPQSGDIAEIYAVMNKDRFLRAQKPTEAARHKFMTGVQSKIDQGHPLCWSLVVGMVSESPPSEKGVFWPYASHTGL